MKCLTLGHIRAAKSDVCFTPENDIKCDIWNIRFGQIVDITQSTRPAGLQAHQDRRPTNKSPNGHAALSVQPLPGPMSWCCRTPKNVLPILGGHSESQNDEVGEPLRCQVLDCLNGSRSIGVNG